MSNASHVFEIIHSVVSQPGTNLSVSAMCEIAGVSRGGYYAWVKRAPIREKSEERDKNDFDLILEAYNVRGYAKGAKSIYMTLLHRTPPVVMNLKKIRRLMAKYNLVCPVRKANPYRRMAKAMRTNHVADNLVQREFEEYGPRVIFLTDITYLPYNGVFAYLSTILDAYTKQILSYVLSDSLEVDFVLETVTQLVDTHGVSLESAAVIHSDQGAQYTSHKFIDILRDKNLRQSMSRRGNCWDNAPMESFFGHMKDHIGDDLKNCREFNEVKALVDDYMDYYNNERYQWDLAKLAPNEYYEFVTTGQYPLKISSPPCSPIKYKEICELGNKPKSDA